MKILVAGLGIIGGSACMALKRAGYKVDGWNRSERASRYALENKIIDAAATNFCEYDVVFIALPPEACVDFINANSFKSGAVVADFCGVKEYIENEVYSKSRNFNYVGCHPMAGKEVSGIENASATLFCGASMVITRDERTDARSVETVRKLARAMGFKRCVECTAQFHDRKIAYTSQLAHIISNAYVKDEEIDGCIGFTGGSFQDMTRIAGVDPSMWASLYLKNSQNVCEKITSLVNSLLEVKGAVEKGDYDELSRVLKNGGKIFDSRRELICESDVKIYEF